MKTASAASALLLTSIFPVLTGCASPSSIVALESAHSAVQQHTKSTRMGVFFTLDSRVADAGERERRERKAGETIMPACVKPYTVKLTAAVVVAAEKAKLSGSLAHLSSLPADARIFDAEFDKCIGRFGVSGYNYVETEDGNEHRVPAYLASIIGTLHNYSEARTNVAAEQESSWSFVLAGLMALATISSHVNPNQTYVDPYTRRDGTRVQGHWRTHPNKTCDDNLRGCR